MAVTPFAILFVTVALSVSAAFGVTNNLAIVSAARSQIGVTVRYDHFDAQAAGVSVANGAEYDPTVSSMVTNAWRVGDQKVKRLWPNNSESDNHASGLLPINYNTQFISPGFTERRP